MSNTIKVVFFLNQRRHGTDSADVRDTFHTGFKVEDHTGVKVEDLYCGASSGSEPILFFSNYFFSLGLKLTQDDFQNDFARGL